MGLKNYYNTVNEILTKCEEVVIKMEDEFGRPRACKIANTNNFHYKYDENNLEHVCIFRIVRIISAIRAILILVNYRFYQEVLILLRTVVEFQNDIMFLLENYQNGKISQHQKKFVEQCFIEHFKNQNNLMEGPNPRPVVSRKKVQAGASRFLSKVWNPTDSNKVTDLEEDVYNGYMHATADCVLEFYGLNNGTFPEFCMNGIENEDKLASIIRQVSIYLHRFINRMSVICEYINFKEESYVLTSERKKFENILKEFKISFD